jgi:hypothetical protein
VFKNRSLFSKSGQNIGNKIKLGRYLMAKNTGSGYRRGAVRQRDQVYNPRTETWTKRDANGRFMDGKADGEPFKGVRKSS